MATLISVSDELEGLQRALDRLRGWQSKAGRSEGVSAWSGDQHLLHIALATDLALSNIEALVKASSPRIVHGEAPHELAVEVLTRGSYPRGESEAPRMVRPPEDVDADLLHGEFESLAEMLVRTRAMAAKIAECEGAIRHQQLGALTAQQWLRFARMHGEHHLAIIEDIAQA